MDTLNTNKDNILVKFDTNCMNSEYDNLIGNWITIDYGRIKMIEMDSLHVEIGEKSRIHGFSDETKTQERLNRTWLDVLLVIVKDMERECELYSNEYAYTVFQQYID